MRRATASGGFQGPFEIPGAPARQSNGRRLLPPRHAGGRSTAFDEMQPHPRLIPNGRQPRTASKSSEKHGLSGRRGGTQRWSQIFAGLFGNVLFYGVSRGSAVIGGESLPLRQLTAMYENPNKIGRFESRRIRAVENHGGAPRPSQIAIIHRPVEAEYFEASAGMFPLR
jgi:hypothetical protein